MAGETMRITASASSGICRHHRRPLPSRRFFVGPTSGVLRGAASSSDLFGAIRLTSKTHELRSSAERSGRRLSVKAMAAPTEGPHLRTCSAARTPTTDKSTEFILSRCNATDYPEIPVQLANTALNVSLTTARSTAAMMARLSTGGGRMSRKGAEAVSDCVDGLGDSVEYLKQSLTEMGRLKGKNVRLRINDAQSWVSTALTDESTCMDEFAEDVKSAGSVKSAVREHVVKVAQLTSNALALISAVAAIE